MKIHQILPTISPNDAVGNEALVIKNELKKMGYVSEIFAQNIHPTLKRHIQIYTKLKETISKNDILIYHHSIGCDFPEIIKNIDSKLIMRYHNVTPPNFFKGVNNTLTDLCQKGIDQLDEFSNYVDLAVPASEFNRIQMKNFGYDNTITMPILLDKTKYQVKTDANVISKFQNSKNVLYVGRIAPNKQIEKIISAFYYYNSNIEPNSNLFLVGNFDDFLDSYYQSLQNMIKRAEIQNIYFVNDADDKKLTTMYAIADVFITMSKHEGFCVPLVESMMFKVPIIANDTSATPYTLGDSGFLVDDQSFEETGELIDMIINDTKLRQNTITKQSKRFSQIYNKKNNEFLEDLISHLQN